MLFLIPVLISGCTDSPERNIPERPAAASETTAETDNRTDGDLQSDIISWFTADIDEDENAELLLIRTDDPEADLTLDTGERYGTYVEIYSDFDFQNDIPVPQGDPDHQFDLSEIKPLYIQAGDINGDGITEIAVCVYKTAEFHPVPAKRPFFYDLLDGGLEPVWLGSRLARPFADYTLFDMDDDGIDEIISIEFTEDGNQVLAIYDWKGFGFEVKAVSEEMEGSLKFLNNKNNIADKVLVEIAGETHQVCLEEGEVIRCIKEY